MPGGVEWTKQGKSTAEVFSKYIQYLACVYCDLLCVNILSTERLLIIFTSVHCCHHTALPSYHSHHHCIYQFIIITVTVMIISFLDQYHGHYHRVCYCNEIIMMIIVYPLLLSLLFIITIVIIIIIIIIVTSLSSLSSPVYYHQFISHRQVTIMTIILVTMTITTIMTMQQPPHPQFF